MNEVNNLNFIAARGNGKSILTLAKIVAQILDISIEEAYEMVWEWFNGDEVENEL